MSACVDIFSLPLFQTLNNAGSLILPYNYVPTIPTTTPPGSINEPAVEQLKRPRPPLHMTGGTGAVPPTAPIPFATHPLQLTTSPHHIPSLTPHLSISRDSRRPHLVPILPGSLLRSPTPPSPSCRYNPLHFPVFEKVLSFHLSLFYKVHTNNF